jgi:hypothetical protein
LLFKDLAAAEAFGLRYRRQLMVEAPGLEVELVHQPVNPQSFGQTLEDAHMALARAKAGHLTLDPAPAPAGVAVDPWTGEVAVALADDGEGHRELVSAVRQSRLRPQPREAARQRFYRLAFPGPGRPRLPDSLDQPAGSRDGERAFMAVVHVDGNNLGGRIRSALAEKNGLQEAVDAWRAVSEQSRRTGEAAGN